jgi:DNA-binding transcriptional LysR family regulator
MQFSDRIGRNLKLRDLNILLAVAEWDSISKAAHHLAISHPVVSKAISDLERTLGVRLLDRSPKGIEPTIYGRAFLDSSRAIFDDLRQGMENIELLSNPASGELRIGCTPPMAAGLTPVIINRLLERYPGVVHYIIESDAAGLRRELIQRNIELFMGRFPRQPRDDDVDVEMLLLERQHVVAGIENPLVRRVNIALGELLDEPWILPPFDSAAESQIQETFQATGLDVPRASLVTNSIPLCINLLRTGRFLTVFPASILEYSTMKPLFAVLPIELPVNSSPVGIVTVPGRMLSSLAKVFIECARSVVKPTIKEHGSDRPPAPSLPIRGWVAPVPVPTA